MVLNIEGTQVHLKKFSKCRVKVGMLPYTQLCHCDLKCIRKLYNCTKCTYMKVIETKEINWLIINKKESRLVLIK